MTLESPFSVLFDSEGVELAVTASFSSSFDNGTQSGLLVMGSSSNGAQFLSLTDNGAVFITGAISVDGGTVDQGDAGTIAESWYVSITDGTQVIGDSFSTPVFITGSVLAEIDGVSVVNSHLQVTGTVNIVEPVTVTGSVILGEQPIEVTGSVSTTPTKCPTTVVTGFNASTTNATVLASNTARCGATFFMDGNASAFIKLGSGADTTGSYSVKIGNNGFFEVPANYVGQIDVIFDKNGSQVLRVTEISE